MRLKDFNFWFVKTVGTIYIFVTATYAANLGEVCTTSLECISSVANSICLGTLGSALCACNRGFYKDSTSCLPIIGSTCNGDGRECTDVRGTCSSGEPPICSCPTDRFLHHYLNTCVTKPTVLHNVCNTNGDCSEISNSICGDTKTCICQDTHFHNSKSKQCTSLPTTLDSLCEFNENCVAINNTICEEDTGSQTSWGKCRCSSDYVADDSKCKFRCISERDCTDKEYCVDGTDKFCDLKKNLDSDCTGDIECLPENSECSQESGTCSCTEKFKPDPENSETICIAKLCPVEIACVPEQYCNSLGQCFPKQGLNEQCGATEECLPMNSACVGDICVCEVNYKPDPQNVNCIRTTCPEDFNCTIIQYCDRDHGGQCQAKKQLDDVCESTGECLVANSICDAGQCKCNAIDYKPNPTNTNCVLKKCKEDYACLPATQYCDDFGVCQEKKNLTDYCQTTEECLDINSSCIEGRCKCISDFKPDSSNTQCIPKVCEEDFFCLEQEYCENESVCKQKKNLELECTNKVECKGIFSECRSREGESVSRCVCQEDYKPNPGLAAPPDNICIRNVCPVDILCTEDEYCDPQQGGSGCHELKHLGFICENTIECRGTNVACIDQLSNDIKICSCAPGFIPDRPITDNGVVCILLDERTTCEGVDVYGNNWWASPGQSKTERCPGRETGVAIWKCQSNGYFLGSQPDYTNCTTPWIDELNDKLKSLMGENNNTIDVNNATIFMTDMESLLADALITDNDQYPIDDNSKSFFGHEINKMINIVDTVVTKMEVSETEDNSTSESAGYEEVTAEAFSITEKLLKFNKPWEQLPTANRTETFTNLIRTMESSGFQLTSKVNITAPDEKYSKTFQQKSFIVTSGTIDSGSFSFPLDSKQREGKESFIKLPPNLNYFKGRNMAKQYVAMDMNTQYAKRNIPRQILNNNDLNVDSARSLNGNLMGFSVSDDVYEETILEDGRVLVTFLHDSDSWGDKPKQIPRKLHPGEKQRAAGGTKKCAQFDAKRGMWSTEGCEIVEESTGPFSTTCSCNRIAKYGLLSEFHEYPGKTTQLQVVTIAGFGISCLLQLYRVYQSRLIAADIQTTLKKFMMIFLVVGNLLLVAFVDRNYFNLGNGWCYFIGMMSHLLVLCAFMVLLTVGVDIYLFPKAVLKKVVENQQYEEDNKNSVPKTSAKNLKVLDALKPCTGRLNILLTGRKQICYFLFCIGVPLLIVIVTIISGVIAGSNSRVYGGDFCWLDGLYIWSFFAPAIVAIVINIIFLLMFTKYMGDEIKKLSTEMANQNGEHDSYLKELESQKTTFQQNVAFSLLMGVTWAVGYYQLGPNYSDSPFTQFAFPILNGLQGVLIYWFHKGGSLTEGLLSNVLAKTGLMPEQAEGVTNDGMANSSNPTNAGRSFGDGNPSGPVSTMANMLSTNLMRSVQDAAVIPAFGEQETHQQFQQSPTRERQMYPQLPLTQEYEGNEYDEENYPANYRNRGNRDSQYSNLQQCEPDSPISAVTAISPNKTNAVANLCTPNQVVGNVLNTARKGSRNHGFPKTGLLALNPNAYSSPYSSADEFYDAAEEDISPETDNINPNGSQNPVNSTAFKTLPNVGVATSHLPPKTDLNVSDC